MTLVGERTTRPGVLGCRDAAVLTGRGDLDLADPWHVESCFPLFDSRTTLFPSYVPSCRFIPSCGIIVFARNCERAGPLNPRRFALRQLLSALTVRHRVQAAVYEKNEWSRKSRLHSPLERKLVTLKSHLPLAHVRCGKRKWIGRKGV